MAALSSGSPSFVRSFSIHTTTSHHFSPRIVLFAPLLKRCSRRRDMAVCFVLEKEMTSVDEVQIFKHEEEEYSPTSSMARLEETENVSKQVSDRIARKKSERQTYLIAAVLSSWDITSMAIFSVYYRFAWQTEQPSKIPTSMLMQKQGGEIPLTEMYGTFALSVGAAVGMEFWARWAHRALWHASLWHMHESHHRPRDGPFELNDIFAIINAVPAIVLLAHGFLNRGLIPGLCFGAGLGITLFGIAYMFVHDGLVHRRFPVGPIADVPYFQRVAAAHKIHHMDKFDGVPYGLFLGPKELQEVGGQEDLEKEIKRRIETS